MKSRPFLPTQPLQFPHSARSVSQRLIPLWMACVAALSVGSPFVLADDVARRRADTAFFEAKIRPLLVKRCYECHSEQAQTAEGGLLLDRSSGWLEGGDSGKAILPGEPDQSLLIQAVRGKGDRAMPPDDPLSSEEVELLVRWVRRGAIGPREDLGDTEFSKLGDQQYLAAEAADHWAFQPIVPALPPEVDDPRWNRHPVDRFVYRAMTERGLEPSLPAAGRVLLRRLSFDLTGLPPEDAHVQSVSSDGQPLEAERIDEFVDSLLHSDHFGEHFARMWLDVARYADTDSFYRPDTRTPHYFPFAFTYRDYVVSAYNADKPFDQFIKEQLAADLLGLDANAPELAALGFLTTGPHANRNPTEAVDDWIDVTTRGLMGLTTACARCHDHKYEPIPTTDYYALHSVFASVIRINPLDEEKQPVLIGYRQRAEDIADYEQKRAAIDKKIAEAGKSKSKNNNRSVAQKIRETELAELLLFHPGAPIHTMVVRERPRPVQGFVYQRGDPTMRGGAVPRRFLSVLDPQATPFAEANSGRLELAERIASADNPLTARVYVNRVWAKLLGAPIVATPSDFGLQGSVPSHPHLLDWITADFIAHGWSTKHLVRTIVTSQTYQQSSAHREKMAAIDSQNVLLWRAHRKKLSIEAIHDSMLAVTGELQREVGGRAKPLWPQGPSDDQYSRRRAIYGYINRFNLDPTLRAFDFPSPMQTAGHREESIVASQALFTMNSKFVIDRANALVNTTAFRACSDDTSRIAHLFQTLFQRPPAAPEVERIRRFVAQQEKFSGGARVIPPWAVLAQALLMSNEFQYVD